MSDPAQSTDLIPLLAEGITATRQLAHKVLGELAPAPPATEAEEEMDDRLGIWTAEIFDQLRAAHDPDGAPWTTPAAQDGKPNPVAEMVGRVSFFLVVAQMTKELGRPTLAQMTKEHFARAVTQYMAQKFNVGSANGFLEAMERALDLPHFPGARQRLELLFKPGGAADVINLLVARGAVAAFWAPREAMKTDRAGKLHYEHTEDSGTVVLSFPPPRQRPERWKFERIKDYGDAEADDLLIIFAKLARADADGGIWITATEILAERGIEKRKKGGYTSGYDSDDCLQVEAELERLGLVQVEVLRAQIQLPPTTRGRPRKGLAASGGEIVPVETRILGLSQKLLQVEETLTQRELFGTGLPMAFYIKPGKWYRDLGADGVRQLVPLAQRLLRYHQRDERWKKRLGTHFALHMVLNDSGQLFWRSTVGQLLEAAGLTFEARNPGRTWKKLVKALQGLQDDHVIGSYQLTVPGGQVYDVLRSESPPSELGSRIGLGTRLAHCPLEVRPPMGTTIRWERLSPVRPALGEGSSGPQ